jgi:4-amino-4-deoxy-L-arabinose transferase-like glycosyltransferase
MSKSTKDLLFVLLLALVLRSLVLVMAFKYPDRTLSGDSLSYIHPANSLLEGQGYTFPGVLRTPVYPMFLALFFALFGEHPAGIVAVQVIVSTLNVALTYLTGSLILPKRVSLIGAFLLAISLESIIEPFFILTDTLFTFLFLGTAYTFLRYRSTRRNPWLISSAILMGLSILCRPIAIYYPVAVVILLCLVYRGEWLRVALKSLMYLAVVFAVLLAWFVRSEILDGAPILSTIANYNLLFDNAASLDASLHGGTLEQYQSSYHVMAQNKLTELRLPPTEANLDKVYQTLAVEKIMSHPLKYLVVHLKDDVKNLLPGWASTREMLTPSSQGGIEGVNILRLSGLSGVFQAYFGGQLWFFFLLLPFMILLGLVYLLDILGVFSLARQREGFMLAVLIFPIAYLLLIPGAPSNSRFRLPAMPEICLMAGIGLEAAWVFLGRKFKSARRTAP